MEFKNLVERRRKYLIGTDEIKPHLLKNLNQESNRIKEEYKINASLCTIKVGEKEVEKVRKAYRDILHLSKVYNITKSKDYLNPIVLNIIKSNLEEIYTKYYNLDSLEHTNWWQWEIGYPLLLNDILILMKDYLEEEIIQKYLEVTKYFQPDPRYSGNNPVAIHPKGNPLRVSTGGNRVDTVKISILRGILLEDKEEILLALNSLPEVWQEKVYEDGLSGEKRDGFYRDGSFIQHGSIGYTGTYGNVLLGGIGEILYLIGGTKYTGEVKNLDAIYERVLNSFEPLFYKGIMPDMVNGRSITRKSSDHKIGHEILNSMMLLTLNAPEQYKNIFQRIIKRELVLDTHYMHEINEQSPFFLEMGEQFRDLDIQPEEYLETMRCFNDMERYFKRTKNYAIGLSLHSHRIGNYETMNGENTRGWFTGDGAYYCYDQLDNYVDYWDRVDFYYIPGTTEIKMDMEGIDAHRGSESTHAKNRWSGGTSIDEYGVIGMDFINWNEQLSSKKSWFFVKGGLIFTETDITGLGDVYSTLENKKLRNREIYVDNEKFMGNKIRGKFKEIKLDGRIYRVETEKFVNLEIENRNGTDFIKIWIEHGINPQKEKLQWTLILDEDLFAMENFKLKYNSEIHVLYNDKITLLNNWSKKDMKIQDIIIKGGLCICYLKNKFESKIKIFDSTRENGKMTIEIDKKKSTVYDEILTKQEEIYVEN